MSLKDIEKKFVGQPIFKQLLPKSKFDILALEHQTDCYYKAFRAWTIANDEVKKRVLFIRLF